MPLFELSAEPRSSKFPARYTFPSLMSSGDLLLLSELFLAQLLRDLECRNSPFEFVSFFFPSGCFFFGKIVMISKRESELFRRSFHRTTNQARQAPASCCLMTSIYGMREKARTYGTSRKLSECAVDDLRPGTNTCVRRFKEIRFTL